MQLHFYMFSTLMSLEDRLRLKLKVKTYVWLDHPYIHSTTVLCDCRKYMSVLQGLKITSFYFPEGRPVSMQKFRPCGLPVPT